jgi:murein DD-endopeptidase MepM/ murein hydrolase activator NlpD
MENGEEKRRKWLRKLKTKYKLVLLDDETYEPRFTLRLSRLNVLLISIAASVILVSVTIVLIVFTPLREYIPGYTDMSLYEKIDELQMKTDSLEDDFRRKNLYLFNLQRIMEGRDTVSEIPMATDTNINYKNIKIARSKEDSILRADFETQSLYNLNLFSQRENGEGSSIRDFHFFTPLNGMVSSAFSPMEEHFGIDIVSAANEAVKATLDGVVIFAGWTLETGYVVSVQHKDNILSVYKHNSSLLVEQGAIVKAGEPIAIVGTTGELSSGPHLHFEVWFNGIPMDPAQLMVF